MVLSLGFMKKIVAQIKSDYLINLRNTLDDLLATACVARRAHLATFLKTDPLVSIIFGRSFELSSKSYSIRASARWYAL